MGYHRLSAQRWAPQDQHTASTYILSAIYSTIGEAAGLVLPWCNTEAMGLHLTENSAQVTRGKHCALLVNQAGWHLIVPRNITIVMLPAKCLEP